MHCHKLAEKLGYVCKDIKKGVYHDGMNAQMWLKLKKISGDEKVQKVSCQL